MGKVLDKIINKRLKRYLEAEQCLSDNQYGFRQGKNTGMAVDRLIKYIGQNKEEGKHLLVVTLDIGNAFNNAWPDRILRMLMRKRVPAISAVIGSFLTRRKIETYGKEYWIRTGCPQGSCLGPTLWLLIMEDLLEGMVEDEEFRVQAFADYLVLIIGGLSVKKVEQKWRELWMTLSEWERRNRLNLKVEKTEAMFVPAGRKVREPVVRMKGERVQLRGVVTYLGLKIDVSMLFIEHLKKVREKIFKLTGQMCGVAGNRLGLRSEVFDVWYQQVVRPIVLYGSEMWGRRAMDSRVKKILQSVQRPLMLRVVPCYKTVANSAVQVLAGWPPIYLEVHERWRASEGGRVSRVRREQVGERRNWESNTKADKRIRCGDGG